MDQHERHTRKPRLFRSKVYPQAGLAALLLFSGAQAPDASAATPAARQLIHDGAPAAQAVPDCGVTASAPAVGTAMHALEPDPNSVQRAAAKPGKDPRVGWAFALLLAGIAVGRRVAPATSEMS